MITSLSPLLARQAHVSAMCKRANDPLVSALLRFLAAHPLSLAAQVSGMMALLSLYIFCPEVVTSVKPDKTRYL
jgi:hypothetical protein